MCIRILKILCHQDRYQEFARGSILTWDEGSVTAYELLLDPKKVQERARQCATYSAYGIPLKLQSNTYYVVPYVSLPIS